MAPIESDAVASASVKNRVLLDTKCSKCNKVVKNGILCDLCDKWIHFKCSKLSEENLPDENAEWICPRCQDRENGVVTLNETTLDSSEGTIASLNKVIKLLKDDIIHLKEENERLRPKLSGNSVNNDWNIAPKHKTFRPNFSANNLTDFPPLKNKFEVLTTVDDRVERIKEVSQNEQTGQNKSSKNNFRPRSLNVCLYADSQGRDIYKGLRDSHHKFYSMVKPGAKFKDVTETAQYDSSNATVFLAGTNDIACNGRKELLSSLRKRIQDLQNRKASNLLVFSVPHRHDLPDTSIINFEVQQANRDIFNVCKHFNNVTFVDISRLGRRFHTRNGLHLNTLGKKFVSSKILEFVNKLASKQEPVPEPVSLRYNHSSFLEVSQS